MTRASLTFVALGLGLLAAAPALAGEKAHTRLWGDPHMDASSGSSTQIVFNSNAYPNGARRNFPALSHNRIYVHAIRNQRVRPLRARQRRRAR